VAIEPGPRIRPNHIGDLCPRRFAHRLAQLSITRRRLRARPSGQPATSAQGRREIRSSERVAPGGRLGLSTSRGGRSGRIPVIAIDAMAPVPCKRLVDVFMANLS